MNRSDFAPAENEFGAFWIGIVPVKRATFFGHPIRVEFSRPYEFDGPPIVETPEGNWIMMEPARIYAPEILVEDFAMWLQIDAHLPEIVARVEAEMRKEPEMIDNPDLPKRFQNVHINVENDPKNPGQWDFVVERNDWESFGWHFTFSGTEFVDSFAGD